MLKLIGCCKLILKTINNTSMLPTIEKFNQVAMLSFNKIIFKLLVYD